MSENWYTFNLTQVTKHIKNFDKLIHQELRYGVSDGTSEAKKDQPKLDIRTLYIEYAGKLISLVRGLFYSLITSRQPVLDKTLKMCQSIHNGWSMLLGLIWVSHFFLSVDRTPTFSLLGWRQEGIDGYGCIMQMLAH